MDFGSRLVDISEIDPPIFGSHDVSYGTDGELFKYTVVSPISLLVNKCLF